MNKNKDVSKNSPKPKKKKSKKRLLLVIPLVAFFALAFRLDLQVTEYRVGSSEISNPIKVAFITDLHGSKFGEEQSVLKRAIERENPDLIVLGGDMYRDFEIFPETRQLLSVLSEFAPFYYIMGNHEYRTYEHPQIIEEVQSYGGVVLRGDYVTLDINGNTIILAGADDPVYSGFDSLRKFRELDSLNGYKILVAHRTKYIEEYLKYDFDMLLTGHAHGGQVRIPIVDRGVFASGEWFPKYTSGLHTHDNNHKEVSHVISRGLSKTHPPFPRVFNRPELVFVTVTPNWYVPDGHEFVNIT